MKGVLIAEHRIRRVSECCGTARSLGIALATPHLRPHRHLDTGEDLLQRVVVLLSMAVVRIGLMGGIVQGHMFARDIKLVLFSERSWTYLFTAGVLTNLRIHLSGSEPGPGAPNAPTSGSQLYFLVTHPELLRRRPRAGLGRHRVLILKL